MEVLRDLLLVALGYAAAELSAYFKWKRDRRDREEDRAREDALREEEKDLRRRAEELEASVLFLTATHRIAIGSSLAGWQDAYPQAMEALSRIRVLMPPDIALAASRHYSAASTDASASMYKATLAYLVNRLREHTGEEIIREFEDYLDEPVD